MAQVRGNPEAQVKGSLAANKITTGAQNSPEHLKHSLNTDKAFLLRILSDAGQAFGHSQTVKKKGYSRYGLSILVAS